MKVTEDGRFMTVSSDEAAGMFYEKYVAEMTELDMDPERILSRDEYERAGIGIFAASILADITLQVLKNEHKAVKTEHDISKGIHFLS